DRLRGEYQLRLGLCPPFAVLVVLLAADTSPLWLVGLPFVALTYVSGVRGRLDAGDFLATAIRLGYCDSPTLRRVGQRGNAMIAKDEALPADAMIADWGAGASRLEGQDGAADPGDSFGLLERVVPGLRDLRAPVVAGSLLLFGLWILGRSWVGHSGSELP